MDKFRDMDRDCEQKANEPTDSEETRAVYNYGDRIKNELDYHLTQVELLRKRLRAYQESNQVREFCKLL